MKKPVLLSLILIFLAFSCIEENDFELGISETNFTYDSIYKSASNGFLFVEFVTTSSAIELAILSDSNSDPQTEIATIIGAGSVTLPIPKDNYWIAIPSSSNEFHIRNTGESALDWLERMVVLKNYSFRWTPLE